MPRAPCKKEERLSFLHGWPPFWQPATAHKLRAPRTLRGGAE